MDDFPNKHSTQATSTVSETERLLSKLGHGYKRAKAQQILRLLKDQESLNKRFKDCALNDDDDDNGDIDDTAPIVGDSPDADLPSGGGGGGGGIAEATATTTTKLNRAEQNSGTRRMLQNIDPSRCRTSMGFYNEAECSETVDGNKEEIIDFEAETDAALMEEREALLGPLAWNSRLAPQGGRRLFRLQLDENDPITEEPVVQSARSSRPKTGIAPGSIKSKQYRRPMQPTENHNHNNNIHNNGSSRNNNRNRIGTANNKNPTISTSVSKLEAPLTTPRGSVRAFCDNPSMPKDDYGCLVSTPRNTSFQPLTPRYGELNLNGNFTPRQQEESNPYPSCTKTPRTNDPALSSRLQHDLALCLTPRNNDKPAPLTPRANDWNSMHTPRHNELSLTSPRPKNPQRHVHKLYNQYTPREDISHNIPSPRMNDPSGVNLTTPRSQAKKHGSLKPVKENHASHQGVKRVTIVEKPKDSTSTKMMSSGYHSNALADRGLAMGIGMPTTPRSILTVDQSPLHAMHGVPESGEVMTPRRQNKSESNNSHKKSKNLTALQRSGVHHNLSKLSERVHPITMMKLPPLEVTMNKPVIS